MIRPTTKNSAAIVATMMKLGFAPWEYPSEVAWQRVADVYNASHPEDKLSAEAIRGRYRRIDSWLERNGYNFEEYAEAVLYESGLLDDLDWDWQNKINEYIHGDSDKSEWWLETKNLINAAKGEPEIDMYYYVDRPHTPASSYHEAENVGHKAEPEIELDAQTPEELLLAAGLDPKFYEAHMGKISHWGNGSTNNWSLSANFRRRDLPDQEVLDYIITAINNVQPPLYNLETPEVDADGVLCVLSIYDVHLEKVEHGRTLEQKILDYHKAVLQLAGKVQNVAQFVLPFGNDFGNFDNVQGATTKGTPQENSVTWQRAVDLRVKLLVWTVETLSEIAPVHVVFVPGNHDQMTTYWLGKVLEQRYQEDMIITTDNSHGMRKYFLWGQVGLMFTHGSEEKLTDLPMLFATEGGEVFGPAVHREIHTGDKHGRALSEKFGVITRILPSLSGTDNWHHGKGYVEQGRAAVALTYTKTRPESEILCYV